MLNERSKQIRRDTIALSKANGGYHYGGSFSAVEILIALYDHVLKDDDKFILSKGHACWPLYVLLRERGLDPKLEGHPSRDERNGIHCTTGSLGHGLPTAVGMAMAKKLNWEPGIIYVLMGDGECQEGTTWESMLIAAKYKLDNLVVIVDQNSIQGSGRTRDVLPNTLTALCNGSCAVGWVDESVDGHDVGAIIKALDIRKGRPIFILAKTIKGKGVGFMEDKPEWHAKWPSPEEEAQALEELK